ncbi:hypothetical protein ACPXCE_10800 [Streptomyces sp. DT24]|uniref:hypothetical protein n=1 Tax=unclassified Streptomyces TaxID=2593676 RepID=UPI0023B91EA4|nr:hypothetical protein [Streptomyces sp. AM 4-1-1]WEH34561.1 hypothetical protein PZB75_15145 [Streptomyces sp. AM 4-1-1]
MPKLKKHSAAALAGAGSLLDLAGGATYRVARRRKARMSDGGTDWQMVGGDLRRAAKAYRSTTADATAR